MWSFCQSWNLSTGFAFRFEHRKWNRGRNGLHQLRQPVAPSILFPVFKSEGEPGTCIYSATDVCLQIVNASLYRDQCAVEMKLKQAYGIYITKKNQLLKGKGNTLSYTSESAASVIFPLMCLAFLNVHVLRTRVRIQVLA